MNMKQKLDDVLTAGVKNGHAPGVVAAMVDKNGLTYIGSAGERTIGTGDVMTTDTVGAIMLSIPLPRKTRVKTSAQ
jgi:hypothetical protein